MVRRVLPLASILALIGMVAWTPAPAADWRTAGGSLFVERGLPAGSADVAAASSDSQGHLARVPPLRQPLGEAVAQAAARHGLDPKLLHSLVIVESGYRPEAVSRAGAAGLTQLMPGTAADLGVSDRFDPQANLFAGADYLARQVRRFGDLRLALAAYNAGPERVARLGRVPRLPETQAYVDAVVSCYLALAAGQRIRSARDCMSGDIGR